MMKANLPSLPSEIIEDILCRLPAKSLIRFRCVKRQWETLLTSDPIFTQKHLTQKGENHDLLIKFGCKDEYFLAPNGVLENATKLDSSCIQPYDQTHIAGSSDGLICLPHHSDGRLFISIWNPATRECKTLPDPEIQPVNLKETIFAFGFGFCSGLNEYKVVKFMNLDAPGSVGSELEVYSLRTNSWIRLGHCPYFILGYSSKAVVNGVVHWSANHGSWKGKPELILSFHMSDDVLREVPMPDAIIHDSIKTFYLFTFRGCLAMLDIIGEHLEMNMWVMRQYGAKESWEKLFRVEHCQPNIPYPYGLLNKDELLFEMYEKMSQSSTLVSYNLKNKSLKEREIGGLGRKCCFHVVPYVESLVSLMGDDTRTKGQEAKGVDDSGGKEAQTEGLITAVADEGV